MSAFGIGTEPVWLNRVGCNGSETHILDCPGTENIGMYTGFIFSVSFSQSIVQFYVGVRCDGKFIAGYRRTGFNCSNLIIANANTFILILPLWHNS